jgi:hypothetical protein
MNEYHLKGLPVIKRYYKGQVPAISNGIFELMNNTSDDAYIDAMEVSVILDGNKTTVEEYHIYQLPDYTEVSKSDFCLSANSYLKVDVSFPFLHENGLSLKHAKVELSIVVNGRKYTGYSPVEIEMRTPL